MITDLVLHWNNKFKYDYLFRRKFNIPFNSSEHRALSPIDVKFAVLEEKMILEERKKYQRIEAERKKYEETGQWLRKRKLSEQQEEELFSLIDFRGYKPYGKED